MASIRINDRNSVFIFSCSQKYHRIPLRTVVVYTRRSYASPSEINKTTSPRKTTKFTHKVRNGRKHYDEFFQIDVLITSKSSHWLLNDRTWPETEVYLWGAYWIYTPVCYSYCEFFNKAASLRSSLSFRKLDQGVIWFCKKESNNRLLIWYESSYLSLWSLGSV